MQSQLLTRPLLSVLNQRSYPFQALYINQKAHCIRNGLFENLYYFRLFHD